MGTADSSTFGQKVADGAGGQRFVRCSTPFISYTGPLYGPEAWTLLNIILNAPSPIEQSWARDSQLRCCK